MNGRAEVARLQKRLDATFSRMPSSSNDLEVQADYAKYLCVLVSGFFECAIVALVLDHVERKSSEQVMSFAEGQLDRWTNPNVEKITNLFGAFSADWRERILAHLVDQRKDSINGLVALRHKIVHGESVGTSLSQIKTHYQTICQVVAFLADIVDPP